MKLLIITQKVDEADQPLGFFVRWLEEFARHFEKISVICLQAGEFTLPAQVRVYPLGKDNGVSKWRQAARFYRLSWQLRHEYDAVLVHMNPIWAALGGPLWRMLHKPLVLWYTHKS